MDIGDEMGLVEGGMKFLGDLRGYMEVCCLSLVVSGECVVVDAPGPEVGELEVAWVMGIVCDS